MNELTLSLEDSPAKTSAWLDAALDWLAAGPGSSTSSCALLMSAIQGGSSSRTSLDFCRRTEDGTWEPSSGRWKNSGMGGLTASLTLSTSEWPSVAAGCSLSDVLETRPVPPRYFLSQRAAQGILRRAEKRGKTLPSGLLEALKVGATSTTSEPDTSSAH
mgnify:CR=1 FL=1